MSQSAPPASNSTTKPSPPTGVQGILRDAVAGLVVFLVALPLCLGIALASGAPLMSGLVAGIVGGLVVGALSGSHTSVSGPAAGLTAVVLAQITSLGSFEAFLLCVTFAGVIQICLGLGRAGVFTTFVPTSVIKGLLAAIGVILILKQIPHVFGHDTDPEGEMAFEQPDHENTFSELLATISDLHMGAAVIGLLSLVLLVAWSRSERLAKSGIPAPLVVVLFGLGMGWVFETMGGPWLIESSHLVQVPVVEGGLSGVADLLSFPDFSRWREPAIYTGALTIAIVASLETLLNVEAVDRLDPQQRRSPANRELMAQGAGNIVAGLLGGLPVTAVIIRGSVNIHAGGVSKRATIVHGALLLGAVLLLAGLLNRIPLSCLAAILLVTGFRLASPALIRKMWDAGYDQFVPFAATVVAIVFTDLLVGLGIGMAIALAFIISRQSKRPVRRIAERHLAREVLHIELPDQVSFLNQAALERVFDQIPEGTQALLDATDTEYIDPDVLAMIREFRDEKAPVRGVSLSMIGFDERDRGRGIDDVQFVDFSARELQERVSPAQVVEILRQGNLRFVTGRRVNRVLRPRLDAYPIAAVLSCIDSRVPAELIFDQGPGDIFSVRVAGNVLGREVLASLEYGCAVAGSRLVVVLGHTRSKLISAGVELALGARQIDAASCGEHLSSLLGEIAHRAEDVGASAGISEERKAALVDELAKQNVRTVVQRVLEDSETIAGLVRSGRVGIVGVLYDVVSGSMEFMLDEVVGIDAAELEHAEESLLALRSGAPAIVAGTADPGASAAQ
ncbi:bifunctional SulP family inorganic anion transporter/carbonic anhydrase [Pseudenhygromyxa sp. WMMC2535]|uniref:bifunctional SulP family inorganic anion transporter/carbonic anhydrase n=1 Tax=Pseudenhygromyxa sp. WMMC2535 TaxID=2712867 RepID=UPI001557D256|nr:SulP family inorganic anion transporter [Pseudenhygromyxa sp. WMMC2535]NVB41631.1 bifunctional SulP family inorganic anion transporter/carbonic anhydrase [Pseudenhygromyxa sp. WMMC2535]NVB43485.1 bifunctional SulP family inorganic anion transporter/carbonic anhydrase [Pseudenhygromyxa sp. WMMC2535]